MKKERLFYLLLLIIPLLLIWLHFYFTWTVDGRRHIVHVDPDYAYMVSAIDIANLKGSRMVLHPGTTSQVMSHLIMRCAYWLSPSGGDDFQTAVLKDPVFYLTVLHHTLGILNIVLVFLLGMFTYHITGKILVGLLIQLTPLLSSQPVILGFGKVTADVVLVFASLLMVLVLVKLLHSDLDQKKVFTYAIILGLVSGFGLATKIPFLVLLVIPLIAIPSLIPKLVYILSTMVSAFVFTLPILPMYSYMYKFLHRISTHTGMYGRGQETIIDPNEFFSNLAQLIKENLPFIGILLTAAVLIVLVMVSPARRKEAVKNIRFKMLFSVTLAQVLGVIMVARHFKSRYLLPVLCLSGLAVYLIYIHLRWLAAADRSPRPVQKRSTRWLYAAAVIFLLFSCLFTMHDVGRYHRQLSHKLKEFLTIGEKINNEYNDYGIVYYYNAPSVTFGLQFGNLWTPLYTDKLRHLYGDRYFYQYQRRIIFNWHPKNPVSLARLEAAFNHKVLFVGQPFRRFRSHIKRPEFPLKDVFGGKYLTIYRLVE